MHCAICTGIVREVDYWIAVSEKVFMERLIHKGMPYGETRRQEFCKSEWRF